MKKLLCAILTTVLLLTAVSCQKTDEPISVTKTVHGCELTVTLDKSKYGLGDIGTASVNLVNKSGKDIELTSNSETTFVKMYFLEDNQVRFTNVPEVGRDISLYETVPDGEGYEFDLTFDLTSPEGAQEPMKNESEWKIKANATIIIDPDGEEKHESISAEITVPH